MILIFVETRQTITAIDAYRREYEYTAWLQLDIIRHYVILTFNNYRSPACWVSFQTSKYLKPKMLQLTAVNTVQRNIYRPVQTITPTTETRLFTVWFLMPLENIEFYQWLPLVATFEELPVIYTQTTTVECRPVYIVHAWSICPQTSIVHYVFEHHF